LGEESYPLDAVTGTAEGVRMMKCNINNILKIFVLVATMTFGFFFIYAFVWFAFDLPITNWAMFLLTILAVISMFGYYYWVREK
jgi:hypothetical protein